MDSPTVLVLGGELGFMVALSVELNKRHIAVVPARTVREARSTLTRFRLSPHVLLINCSSPGACTLAEDLVKLRRDVRIIGMISERYQCKKCAHRLAAQLRDPEDQAPDRIPHCADIIETLVREQERTPGRAGGN